LHVGVDRTGVLEAGGYLLLLPKATEVCLPCGVVPGLRVGWNNDQFKSHIIGTLLKIDGCKIVWDTVRY